MYNALIGYLVTGFLIALLSREEIKLYPSKMRPWLWFFVVTIGPVMSLYLIIKELISPGTLK